MEVSLWSGLQLAKLAGNTVVATCGGKEKAKLLQDLGVDRVIDYKAEDIKTVCILQSSLSLSSIMTLARECEIV